MREQWRLASQLAALWAVLLDQGARVSQVPFDSPVSVLRARIAAEERRVRALAEREAS